MHASLPLDFQAVRLHLSFMESKGQKPARTQSKSTVAAGSDIPHFIVPPTYEEIATCAYLIWEQEGRPHGRDIAHWHQAEAQLFLGRMHDASMLATGDGSGI
jgi:hypothetical protein